MVPKSKFDRVVLVDQLLEAGLTLITEAQQSGKTGVARARGIRNGMMLTLLALFPFRRKNFAALELGAPSNRSDPSGGSHCQPMSRKNGAPTT